MATKRGLLVVFLTIGLVTTACAGGDSEGGSTTVGSTTVGSTTGGEDLPTLKVGVPLPFTGVVAESAEEMRQTFLMYVEEQGGTLGGLPVEVIFEDTETDAELVVTKTRKLIDEDQVHLISGPMLAFEGLAMLDSVNQAGIPWVGQTGVAADDYTRLETPTLSAAAKHTASQETMPLGTYAYEDLGYRTIATLGQDYAWGYQTVGGFQYAFEAAGGDVVQKLWAPIGTTDFAPFVNDINQDVDAVYVTLIGADIPRFVQAYSDFGLKENIPMLASEDLVAQDAIRFYSGDAAIGIIGITPFTANLDRPEMQAFVEAYSERTGNIPTFWGESSYVAAMVIDRTLQYVSEANDIALADLPEWVRSNGEAFAAATREIDLSDAPSSAITVDEFNRQVRDFYIVELVDEGGTITDSLVETVPEVTQFWTFDQQEFLADPLFSREDPPA
ncbi:MAG TPA: ABC transporter substrate-binding protein [Actinomycetota bacterium]|nr:ABC transporter substrate-binding protein [Actinomycetota bacterium]